MFAAAFGFVKDLLFPVACLSCEKEGAWCCKACLASFSVITHQRCPSCGHLTASGETCAQCLPSSALDGITALYDYHESQALARLIKALKYQLAYDCASVLPSVIRHAGEGQWHHMRKQGAFSYVPVPLHPRRERERGFNQAQRIADAFADAWREEGLSVGCAQGLVRARHTLPQAELGAQARRSNLDGAFAWNGIVSAPEKIVLIDDVFTTGTTMQECARELKRHGARWVWGLALARG